MDDKTDKIDAMIIEYKKFLKNIDAKIIEHKLFSNKLRVNDSLDEIREDFKYRSMFKKFKSYFKSYYSSYPIEPKNGRDVDLEFRPNLAKKRGKKKSKNPPIVTGKSKLENLTIISINARGLSGKRKSIEEILKNNNVDIARVRFSWLQGYYVTGLIKGKGVLTD